MKKLTVFLLIATLLLTGCQSQKTQTTPDSAPSSAESSETAVADAVEIVLGDDGVTVDGQAVTEDSAQAVYIANDIVYYPTGQDFTFGEGTEADAHEAAEADAHTVVHITQPGTYSLSGTLSAGQVAVDLGDDAEEDPDAVVTLILDGVDISCSVAPAVIFYNVYECGSTDTETASETVDTTAAGANVVIADGSVNNVSGSYVARIYKPDSVSLSEDGTEVVDSKKLHKYDAAFYSKMTMNVDGNDGVLNINAENEGLDSELHLTINGGNINIVSGNDGINTNEDGVSVTTINGGNLTITVSGETGEGDGIDSNGWLVINGGNVIAAACDNSADSGIDSDMGIHINGGTVVATGHMLDRIEDGSQNYAVFTFAQKQAGGTAYTLRSEDGSFAADYAPANAFSILLVSDEALTPGNYTFWSGDTQLAAAAGQGFGGMGGGMIPGGMTPPEGMEFPEGMKRPGRPEGGMTPPEGMELPEGMERPELPEGMERPQGGFGRPGDSGQMGAVGETSTTFNIAEGANYFSSVAPAQAAGE